MGAWTWLKSKFSKNPTGQVAQGNTPIEKITPIFAGKSKFNYEPIWRLLVPTPCPELNWWKDKLNEGMPTYGSWSARFYELTGVVVPAEIFGVVHGLECSFDFSKVLHNGEDIVGKDLKTSLVPAGRGPFETAEAAAIDAFLIKPIPMKWTVDATGFFLEGFNGFGYRKNSIVSPYLVGKSNLYTKGKYIRDHVYDKSAVSSQVGAFTGLKSIGFSFEHEK